MHILIAPNAFKNSITAREAAKAIERGLKQSQLSCTTECFPIADGGDGTAELIIEKLQGKHVMLPVHDPLGRMIDASFGLIENDQTAVIEMADASGLRLLKHEEHDPLRATSFGTGEMIKKALDLGVKKIIIAMGGSATVDGGTGILSALGAQFLDDQGRPLENLPENLAHLAKINNQNIEKRIADCEFIVLCDVDNKLLGAKGAAAVFGPQKGADAEAVRVLDEGLEQFCKVTSTLLNKDMAAIKYGGAAGGASAGVWAWLNARLVNGIEYFLDLTSFDRSLEKSQVVITGEGSIDEQTLQGKGPFGVANRAKGKHIPVIGLAGKIPLEINDELKQYFDILTAIGNEPTDLQTALTQTKQNLQRVACEIGNSIQTGIHISR